MPFVIASADSMRLEAQLAIIVFLDEFCAAKLNQELEVRVKAGQSAGNSLQETIGSNHYQQQIGTAVLLPLFETLCSGWPS